MATTTDRMLTLTSLIAVILLSLHVTDDVVRGLEKEAALNLVTVPILTFWLWVTLVLARPRWGYGILFLGGLFAAAMPVIHLRTMSGEFVASGGGFFTIWLLIALGVTGLFSAILALRGLWAAVRMRGSA
ncbi:MAG TPA: hypothetical protein VLG68_00405 [Gammaproteobacteria bacterium]|nr:hypothetical protein [Gammaproteobacteria bacterium]